MSRAFLIALRAHDCLVILNEAKKICLDKKHLEKADMLIGEIEKAGISGELVYNLQNETKVFIRGLRGILK